MGEIAIEGIEIYGYHGVYPIEKEKGNLYRVDVYMRADLSKASVSDSLADTLDYHAIYKLVLKCMEIPTQLLERLAARIGQEILLHSDAVVQVRVRVSKIKPLAMERCRHTYVEMLFDKPNPLSE